MSESKRERYIRLLKSKADLNFVELTFDAVKEIIELLEETSAEPKIIRCKDCKYWQDNNDGYFNDECRWWNEETPEPDDFCSYAERRGEEE